MPLGGMESLCRVVVGSTPPNGWKITSADQNVEQFLIAGGSLVSRVV